MCEVRAAPALAAATGAPVLLHPADLPVWRLTHPRTDPGGELADGQGIIVGGTTLRVLHTPGHPGHGPDTTIGTEAPGLQGWIARGH